MNMDPHFGTIITFTFLRSAQTKQEKSFLVPSGCSTLTLRYDADAASGLPFPVFLMVKSPEGKTRFLRQLSYGEPVIRIGTGAPDTTIGGVPGPISAGEWKITVFLSAADPVKMTEDTQDVFSLAVSISDQDVPVRENVGANVWTGEDLVCSNFDFEKVYAADGGWYKGDLHTHTRLSNGQETPQNASRKAAMMELDYYVPTENNALHTGWPKTKVMIVPGIEITSVIGHMNLFGIDRKPRALESVLSDQGERQLAGDYEDLISECKNRGWLISINHPYLSCREWQYRDFCLPDLDCLEIVNDPTYAAMPDTKAEEANEKAIRLSDLLWEDGYRVCAIGGSDSRRLIDDHYPGAAEPSVPGDPATWLYMERLSPAAFKEALRDCSAYVSRHCTLRTPLRFGAQLPQEQEWLHYEIYLRGYRGKPDIFYKHNGMHISCRGLKKEIEGWSVHGSIYLNRTAEYHCIRFGAQDENGAFLFYANPITRGRRAHRFLTFGEASDALRQI